MANRRKGGKAASKAPRKVRYAVVGLGHIAQDAVLPAFKHAKGNSELVALVSDDPAKLKALGRKYGISHLFSYEQYDECLASGLVDAVYIALPNHLHRDYSLRAISAGVHVLCEKPMEISSRRCQEMLQAARSRDLRLMIAYRLHFEEANLSSIELVKKGRIGEPRVFNSVFAMAVKDENIRTNPREIGGGPTYDIGIYPLNAARYIFQDEPTEVVAMDLRGDRKRFRDIEESMAVTLRFPGERVANFVVSYNTVSEGYFEVLGTKGTLKLEEAFGYAGPKKQILTIKGKARQKVFKARDQFAPELIYFSDCVIEGREPEPSGQEGYADVRIIEAIFESSRTGRAVKLESLPRKEMPGLRQEIQAPPVREPELIHVESPSKEQAG